VVLRARMVAFATSPFGESRARRERSVNEI
jgi:hypothetical protein